MHHCNNNNLELFTLFTANVMTPGQKSQVDEGQSLKETMGGNDLRNGRGGGGTRGGTVIQMTLYQLFETMCFCLWNNSDNMTTLCGQQRGELLYIYIYTYTYTYTYTCECIVYKHLHCF